MEWRGRLFLGMDRLVYAGPIAPTQVHAHHAIQIVVVQKEPDTLSWKNASGQEAAGRAAVIPADADHAIVSASVRALMILVEPESDDGRKLSAVVTGNEAASWIGAGTRVDLLAHRAPPVSFVDAMELARAAIELLTGSSPVRRSLHPSVTRVLRSLAHRIADDDDVAVKQLARDAGLSPSRLQHVFRESIGIPIRRYILWARLRQAALALQRRASITDAALEGGFADAAHMTRTFKRMFGIAPTDVVDWADWVLDESID
jgi:AraC-like DNA-binding protein